MKQSHGRTSFVDRDVHFVGFAVPDVLQQIQSLLPEFSGAQGTNCSYSSLFLVLSLFGNKVAAGAPLYKSLHTIPYTPA